ncbi:hypothetical protein PR202_gb22916 [Eleusine coracana subsp. coracana]|uniref:F-box domain-containing protein n=1 Tax=Eleusine coracana subsp. coracana TaxID=191504 RepID=A0AAV5FHS2_ELECO|nr:hypothetical protein PR202_gb22916 [Eleusine coracana subsp. coracana]
MEDLPVSLFGEIVKRLTKTSDLNSLSLVSKGIYTIEGELRDAIYVGCGVHPAKVPLVSLCSRFPNLCKVEFNYSCWTPSHGMQLDNKGLHVFSSCCPSLTDLTLSSCSYVDDTGLGFLACFKRLMYLKLNALPAITSSGLLSVAVGCKTLSALHLDSCKKLGSANWLEYLGSTASLEELVVKYCKKISQFDLLKFGPGWMKLQKFEFQISGLDNVFDPRDPMCVEHCQYTYDFSCESLKDLTLARITTEHEMGLSYLLRKCKALENLCLHYVLGIKDNDMITLLRNCSNLRTISLCLTPRFNEGHVFRTSLTDDCLKALALGCPMLQSFELIFWGCDEVYREIGFTQEGLVMLIQSCPIRDFVLSGAHIFDDDGVKALSCAQFLETLELMNCMQITDAGMRFLARAPRLINLILRQCDGFTDDGVGEVIRACKLESLIVEGCSHVS